ncbi:MAG: hypothetical protein HY778_01110 [Betaproteobacteria bacterium]|nr:hypothetical protein [Betaproteobacteria bacterium]
MKQNITLAVDSELLREAKVLAARRNTSISRMLAEDLEELVRHERAYRESMLKALALMEEGLPLGGRPLTREQAHERR